MSIISSMGLGDKVVFDERLKRLEDSNKDSDLCWFVYSKKWEMDTEHYQYEDITIKIGNRNKIFNDYLNKNSVKIGMSDSMDKFKTMFDEFFKDYFKGFTVVCEYYQGLY